MAIESKMYQPPRASFGKDETKKKFPVGLAVGILILIVVIAAGGWFFFLRKSGNDVLSELQNGQTEVSVPTGTYQAVFLDNGQVYFGELKEGKNGFYLLTNIYYLQNKQSPQSTDPTAINSDGTALVKLGNEMHGPEDEMQINKDHVLFIEDLKGDSKVSKAIADYLSKKK
ncbi:MAG: hypothetical protein V1664_01810 [Candidatus Uhrbacteria bacterium]